GSGGAGSGGPARGKRTPTGAGPGVSGARASSEPAPGRGGAAVRGARRPACPGADRGVWAVLETTIGGRRGGSTRPPRSVDRSKAKGAEAPVGSEAGPPPG